MKITVLGCGASLGTPAAGGFWGACDPQEPKNERTRASLLVQSAKTSIVIDATCDLRLHLNRVQLQRVDALLLSHAHSDHINGLDEMRGMSYRSNHLIPVYSNETTLGELHQRWPYMFNGGGGGLYQPFLKRHEIGNYQSFHIGDINIDSFEQDHGTCNSLGFRFDNLAYSVDVANLDEKALHVLKGIETWIVDGAGYNRDHVSTHANLKRVMEWTEIIRPKMTYLTVLTTHMDYKTLCEELPPHIRPAYDGMEIDMGSNLR